MILYFSATGNSLRVAQLLSRELGGDRLVDLRPCYQGKALPLQVEPGERIGLVFPVHSWGMPKGLEKIVASFQIEGYDQLSNHAYMVCTCGDDAGLTARQWQHALAKAGMRGDAAYSVFMPNTYVLLPGFDTDRPEVEAKKLAEVPGAVAEIAKLIKSGKTGDFTHHGSLSWLKSKVIYPLFLACMTDRPFHASPKCVACGLCAAVCPTANISLSSDKHPRWTHRNCINCLACYHRCPQSAINYAKATTHKSTYHL